MRRMVSLFLVLAAGVVAAAPGCTSVECGVGTIERNGACEPSDSAFGSAACGSGTVLIGDRCVTTVECDPGTTMAVVGSDGSVVCVGVGQTVPCGMALACPQPAPGKQSICGQLYDIEDGTPFEPAGGGTGTPCTSVTADGPCALRMDAYDAIDFAHNPTSATPLTVGQKYMDDCGRYRFIDVAQPSSPFIGVGFDDADDAKKGPAGVTNAVGIAVAANPDNKSVQEAWIAKKSTTDMWASGGPTVAAGFHVLIFRAHKCDASTGVCTGDAMANQDGVQIYKNTVAVPNNDYYFAAADTGHTTIDAAATSTGMNGTGLLTGASVDDGLVWTGMGGLSDTTNCKWETHAAASVPNVVTFQVYRPANQVGHTCNQ